MDRQHTIAGAPEIRITVRVRGMSQDHHYFDEQTTTTSLTRDFIVIVLRERVDLDTELHITNMRNQVGGTYRVAWTGAHSSDGLYRAGLEILDPEGEIWEEDSLLGGPENGDAPTTVVLECKRCNTRVATQVPEAESAALGEGFTIARACETCKATTGWIFCEERPYAVEAAMENTALPDQAAASAPKPYDPTRENREKGRAPLRMAIKIIRSKYGRVISDICETINVSRTGVYFATAQGYDPGEVIDIIMPYTPDSLEIPIRARVVRRDERPETYQKRIAIHLLTGTSAAG